MEEKEIRNIIREAFEEFLNERKRRKKKKKGDRCTKIAKRKYNRWPSAYASGAVVQCRAGDIWKDLKGESVDSLNEAKAGTPEELVELLSLLPINETAKDLTNQIMSDLKDYYENNGELPPIKTYVYQPEDKCIQPYELEVDFIEKRGAAVVSIGYSEQHYIQLYILQKDVEGAYFRVLSLPDKIFNIIKHECSHYYLSQKNIESCLYHTHPDGMKKYYYDRQELVLHSREIFDEFDKKVSNWRNEPLDKIKVYIADKVKNLRDNTYIYQPFPQSLQNKYVAFIMNNYIKPNHNSINESNNIEYFGSISEVYNEWSRPMYLKEDSMVSEALKYHLDNGISLSECVFRYGSEEYFNVISEVKKLYENDVIDLNENDEFIVSEHDDDFCVLGGEKIKLNFIFEEVEGEPLLEESFIFEDSEELNGIVTTKKKHAGYYEVFVDGEPAGYVDQRGGGKEWSAYDLDGNPIVVGTKAECLSAFGIKKKISKKQFSIYSKITGDIAIGEIFNSKKQAEDYLSNSNYPQSFIDKLEIRVKDNLQEAEYQGKKVELGKPKRGGSGEKKFYVYVRNPKTGKIKKVSFGAKSGGGKLAVKLRDPKARKRFADRHNCEQKNDKTTPGYWSCRLPRFSRLLNLSGGGKWW